MIEFEELTAGEPARGDGGRAPASRLLGWCALLLAAVVVGYVVLGRGPGAEPVAGPTPTPTPAPSAEVSAAADYVALQYLRASEVCAVRTDGRKRLSVSFRMLNPSATSVEVVDLAPDEPVARGLWRMPVTAGGTCARPGRGHPAGMIAPGRSRLFTLSFILTGVCPQASPIIVGYRIEVVGRPMSAIATIFSSLDSVDFDSCPPRHR